MTMSINANPDPDYFGNTSYLFLNRLFTPHNILLNVIAFRLANIDNKIEAILKVSYK